MSEIQIPHIPEMARTPEVSYLGCTCFLPSNIFLLCTDETAAASQSKHIKEDFVVVSDYSHTPSVKLMALRCTYRFKNIDINS